MKVYINNFNENTIFSIQTLLSDLLITVDHYIEIYTNEGIYQVDSNHIYLLEPKDGETFIYKNYVNDVTLIVDNSYFLKTISTSIHGNEHIHVNIKKHIYKLNPKSKLRFIIEIKDALDKLMYDVYFECDEMVNIKELFIKQEIIEFLSLLN